MKRLNAKYRYETSQYFELTPRQLFHNIFITFLRFLMHFQFLYWKSSWFSFPLFFLRFLLFKFVRSVSHHFTSNRRSYDFSNSRMKFFRILNRVLDFSRVRVQFNSRRTLWEWEATLVELSMHKSVKIISVVIISAFIIRTSVCIIIFMHFILISLLSLLEIFSNQRDVVIALTFFASAACTALLRKANKYTAKRKINNSLR